MVYFPLEKIMILKMTKSSHLCGILLILWTFCGILDYAIGAKNTIPELKYLSPHSILVQAQSALWDLR